MSLLKRRKAGSSPGVRQLDGLAGELPAELRAGPAGAEIVLAEAYASGLAFEAARDELGLAHPQTLQAAYRYAVALGGLGDRRSDAIDLLEWLAGATADDEEYRLLVLDELIRLLDEDGRLARAEELLREAVDGWARLRGADDLNTLAAANRLAKVLIELARPAEADGLIRDTIARRTRLLGSAHPDTVTSRSILAGTLRGTPARLAEAESMYRTILADIGPGETERVHAARHELAVVLYHQGKAAAAERMLRDLLAERERDLGPEHPDVLRTRNHLAGVLDDRGQLAAAEAQLAEVYAISTRVLGPYHPDTLGSQVNLAAIRANQGRTAEAVPLLRAAIDGYRLTHGPDHPDLQALQAALADLGQPR